MARQAGAGQHTAPAKGKANPQAAKARRVDWDAVERDFRTGKFTQRELAEKYGVTHGAIGKQARNREWTQDLGEQIRQATNAKLVSNLVAKEVAKGSQAVADTVLAAAEINTQVILRQRGDLTTTRNVATDLLAELSAAALMAEDAELLSQILAGSGATPANEAQARAVVQKALNINSRIGSIKALAETFSKLQEAERKAFNIEDGSGDRPADPMADFLAALSSRGSRLPMGGAK